MSNDDKFEDEIPWEHIRYPALPAPPEPDLVKYWYKARGLSRMGFAATWEGGLSAAKVGATLGIVKNKSLVWACKRLDYISIHDYDLNGLLNEMPILSQSFYHRDTGAAPSEHTIERKPYSSVPHRPAELGPVMVVKKPALDFFEESAFFTSNDDLNERFTTIKLKETHNDNLNRG